MTGKSNCPYYAKAELLADKLASSVDAFNVHKIVKTPSEWEVNLMSMKNYCLLSIALIKPSAQIIAMDRIRMSKEEIWLQKVSSRLERVGGPGWERNTDRRSQWVSGVRVGILWHKIPTTDFRCEEGKRIHWFFWLWLFSLGSHVLDWQNGKTLSARDIYLLPANMLSWLSISLKDSWWEYSHERGSWQGVSLLQGSQ